MPEPTDYDRFVDWKKRLAREAPFYRQHFEAAGVRSVIDVGCGTGMLPIMWASWGLDVLGVDPDEGMLAKARTNADESCGQIEKAGGSVAFAAAGFGGIASLGQGPFDALTCTGNALPHIDGAPALVPTLRDFASVLTSGGLLVLHLLNHDRLLAGSVRTIPPVVRDTEDGTTVFLRVMDYVGDRIRFDFVTLHRPADAFERGEDWQLSSRRSAHTALPSTVLVPALEEAGFGNVCLFGSHDGAPFRADADESVIVVATRIAPVAV